MRGARENHQQRFHRDHARHNISGAKGALGPENPLDVEFNFGRRDAVGGRPHPVCMLATELRGGRTWRLFEGEFGPAPPFPIGPETLCVAYYSSAEWGCFLALGWPMPVNVLDLFVEFQKPD
jgi:hypothetical protein